MKTRKMVGNLKIGDHVWITTIGYNQYGTVHHIQGDLVAVVMDFPKSVQWALKNQVKKIGQPLV